MRIISAIEIFTVSKCKIMKQFTSREIFGACIVPLVGFASLASWRVYFDMSLDPSLVNIAIALFCFSLLGPLFLLGAVTWRKPWLQILGVTYLFLPSFLFIHTWQHFFLTLFSGAIVFSGVQSIQSEIEDRVRFHFFRNVRAGSFMFVLGLALVLSSAYFSSIRTESWEQLVPRFSIGQGTATALIKTVAYLYPDWKNIADEGMTVDGFLLSLKKDDTVGAGSILQDAPKQSDEMVSSQVLSQYLQQNAQNVDQTGLVQELTLSTGRQQIALLVGRSVEGDEKIADVFSLAIQHKIIAALSGEQASRHLSPTIIPVILTLFLFCTLLPIGSLVCLLWTAIGLFLFQIALFFGWIKLESVEREQQVLLP